MEHFVHIGKVVFRTFVFGEMSDYDSFELGEDAPNLQLMKHTVYLRHRLAGIFNEKNETFIGTVQEVIVRPCQTTKHGEIASHQDAFCLALLVERMGRHLITGHFAQQQTTQDGIHGVALTLGRNTVTHGAMDARHTCRHLCAMQGRCIAKTHNPFGMTAKLAERDAPYHLYGTIASTTTHNGLHGRVP